MPDGSIEGPDGPVWAGPGEARGLALGLGRWGTYPTFSAGNTGWWPDYKSLIFNELQGRSRPSVIAGRNPEGGHP